MSRNVMLTVFANELEILVYNEGEKFKGQATHTLRLDNTFVGVSKDVEPLYICVHKAQEMDGVREVFETVKDGKYLSQDQKRVVLECIAAELKRVNAARQQVLKGLQELIDQLTGKNITCVHFDYHQDRALVA